MDNYVTRSKSELNSRRSKKLSGVEHSLILLLGFLKSIVLTKQATGIAKKRFTFERGRESSRKRVRDSSKNLKTVLIFKHLRNNVFGRNDTLLFGVKGHR